MGAFELAPLASSAAREGHQAALTDILAELALEPSSYRDAYQSALLRLLAREQARQQGFRITSGSLEEALDRFRREHGLLGKHALTTWLANNDIDWDHLLHLIEDEAQVRWVESVAGSHVAGELVSVLRLGGR